MWKPFEPDVLTQLVRPSSSSRARTLSAAARRSAGLSSEGSRSNTQTSGYNNSGTRDVQTSGQGKRQIFAEHRDLFRRPLSPEELNKFQVAILDPPRAGAKEQVSNLGASKVPDIAYVSCNPASFARDAKTLVAAGYRLQRIWPVGQFRWSTHIELVGHFSR